MNFVEIILAVVFAACAVFLIWRLTGAWLYILRHHDEQDDKDKENEKQNNPNHT